MPREYIGQPGASYQRRPQLSRGDEWVREFLRKSQIGRIATIDNNQPFINTTTFWYDEPNNQIIFHSNIAGRVRSNIEKNPIVSFETDELGRFLPSNVAMEFSLQFRSVVVFGQAKIITEFEVARQLLYGLIRKYFPDMEPGKEYREITNKELRATTVYAIRIESWSGKENWVERADQSDDWLPLDLKWFG